MRCDLAREALSARLDGELNPLEEEGLAAHLQGCAPCRGHARELATLHRTVRVRAAAPVPDLTRAIVATAGARLPTSRRAPAAAPRLGWARYGLLGVGLLQLLLALPELVVHSHAGHDAHMTRELGAFGVALAIGMLVVAWQPQRAGGLLPMTFALTAAVTVTAVADVVLGHSGPSGQATHFLELIGLVLLWHLARTTRPARTTRTARSGASGPQRLRPAQ
jgi:RNA polymerase sigma-70 factor (ECF subfamily)